MDSHYEHFAGVRCNPQDDKISDCRRSSLRRQDSSGVATVEHEFGTCVCIVYRLYHKTFCFDELEDVEFDQILYHITNKCV